MTNSVRVAKAYMSWWYIYIDEYTYTFSAINSEFLFHIRILVNISLVVISLFTAWLHFLFLPVAAP